MTLNILIYMFDVKLCWDARWYCNLAVVFDCGGYTMWLCPHRSLAQVLFATVLIGIWYLQRVVLTLTTLWTWQGNCPPKHQTQWPKALHSHSVSGPVHSQAVQLMYNRFGCDQSNSFSEIKYVHNSCLDSACRNYSQPFTFSTFCCITAWI